MKYMDVLKKKSAWSLLFAILDLKKNSLIPTMNVILDVTIVNAAAGNRTVGNYRTKRQSPKFQTSLPSFLKTSHPILRNHRNVVPTFFSRAGASVICVNRLLDSEWDYCNRGQNDRPAARNFATSKFLPA